MKTISINYELHFDQTVLCEELADQLTNLDDGGAEFVILLLKKINLHEVSQKVHQGTRWAKYDPDPTFN